MSEVFSKKQDLPVYAEPNPSASVVGKLKFAEKASVVSTQGRWLSLKLSSGKSGWVYSGNVGDRRPPEENKADLLAPSSGVNASAAARGLSAAAMEYADRHGEQNAAEALIWVERQNAAVKASDVTAFMKKINWENTGHETTRLSQNGGAGRRSDSGRLPAQGI
ncbi:SH3 domain-containing protein [Kamptonema cortianum]|nr:SH3 domain-containing protein [Oscillatoria laete-virens]MDK3159555.1 SH3 domain-containing protein [Kamptonema cortianum]MDL5053307.1 SH3 domain-containing protein [Oscillatoria laete-virens NRMC-F 0139]